MIKGYCPMREFRLPKAKWMNKLGPKKKVPREVEFVAKLQRSFPFHRIERKGTRQMPSRLQGSPQRC